MFMKGSLDIGARYELFKLYKYPMCLVTKQISSIG